MKLHAPVISALPLRSRSRDASATRALDDRPGGVRLISALLLLAVPLAVVAWGLGNYAAQRERNNADNELAASLQSAGDAYHRVFSDTASAANRLAKHRRVQLHFLRGKSGTLVWKATPEGRVSHWFAAIPRGAEIKTVNVVSKGRKVGRVVVFLPLDSALVNWLTSAADLGDHKQLGFAAGGTLVGANGRPHRFRGARTLGSSPRDIHAGGSSYRAVRRISAPDADGTKLVALEGSSYIDSRAGPPNGACRPRLRRLIAALLALAYAVSPSIARSRVSRQERERPERVLAHMGDGVFLVDREGVIRLWNPAAEAITGLRADEIATGRRRTRFPGWPAIAARGSGGAAARRDGRRVEARDRASRRRGREVWLSIVGVALADGIVYAFRDVTRERRLEDLRSQFVATIRTSCGRRSPHCTAPR